MKARIVEITRPDNEVVYVIQQKHWLFRWMWVNASRNHDGWSWCRDTFYSLNDAKKNICWFDGTKNKVKVIKNA